jgi:hypothetical protein
LIQSLNLVQHEVPSQVWTRFLNARLSSETNVRSSDRTDVLPPSNGLTSGPQGSDSVRVYTIKPRPDSLSDLLSRHRSSEPTEGPLLALRGGTAGDKEF